MSRPGPVYTWLHVLGACCHLLLQGVNFNLLDRIGEGGGSIGSAEVSLLPC